ncbi:MAG: anthrone oxygenase family protein [Paraglaciecola sp.]|uniref:anthrone oxygenase family protein n=1 Tax=Paraglaciecola sp. TaxID=1920173 RepID=UPI0032975FA5
MIELSIWAIVEIIIKLAMIIMIGLYFIFSNTVMGVLASAEKGEEIMISINEKILNPIFLGGFFISGVGSLTLFIFSSGAISAAGAVFFVGTVAVTIVFNVPLNNKLRDAATHERATIWQEYLSKWVFWNHLRTGSGVVAGLLLCL